MKNPWGWIPTLYLAEGLPYVTVMTICTIMYKRFGLTNTEIAFYTAWLYLPWVIKPVWSPIVDIIGTKRRWILATQALLGVSMAAVAFALPTSLMFSASLAAFWLMAFVSATHDIAADGFYILALSERQQSLFVGIRTVFYRAALVIGQGALVVLAGWLELTSSLTAAWMWIFAIMSCFFVIVAIYHGVVLPHPSSDHPQATLTLTSIFADFKKAFATFFTKPGIVGALLFMLLYRLPEAQLVKLISPFLLDATTTGGMGLTTAQVGIIYGTVGIIGLMVGGVIGGVVASKGGLEKWMRPMAWSMSLTCLTFLYLAVAQPQSTIIIALCVLIEQLGYGFGGTAYMLYLIRFSQGRWSTSHYAISTGIMALGMMLPGMAAGWIADTVGYPLFFGWTMICCVATIAVAHMVKIPK